MTLEIYMKSGNVLKADKVERWEARYREDEITSLSITQVTKGFFKCKNKLKVGTVSLSQIEAIIETT